MPARSPFTAVCQALSRPSHTGRADLHLHTTCSDGLYSPAQVIGLAVRLGLAAVAITDHDTLAAYEPAVKAAAGRVEIVPGVEITTQHDGRELHLLAYFVDPADHALAEMLARIRRGRAERFAEMVRRVRAAGASVAYAPPDGDGAHSLGRRTLAEMMVNQGFAGSVREAFQRHLLDRHVGDISRVRPETADAIAAVHDAGGVASWAHPHYDGTDRTLADLSRLGLDAVEAEYPATKPTQAKQWRHWAKALGLAVSGGSDCHGAGPRSVGCRTVSDEELQALRHRAGAR